MADCKIFKCWRERLESEPGLWALTAFNGNGGVIWRNARLRDFDAVLGYFATTTAPYAGVKHHLDKENLAAMEAVFAEALKSGEVAEGEIEFTSPSGARVRIRLYIKFLTGDMNNGIALTRSLPLKVSSADDR